MTRVLVLTVLIVTLTLIVDFPTSNLLFGVRISVPSLINPAYCCKTPIVVGWTFRDDANIGHAASLVGYEGELSHVSLNDESGKPLPVW